MKDGSLEIGGAATAFGRADDAYINQTVFDAEAKRSCIGGIVGAVEATEGAQVAIGRVAAYLGGGIRRHWVGGGAQRDFIEFAVIEVDGPQEEFIFGNIQVAEGDFPHGVPGVGVPLPEGGAGGSIWVGVGSSRARAKEGIEVQKGEHRIIGHVVAVNGAGGIGAKTTVSLHIGSGKNGGRGGLIGQPIGGSDFLCHCQRGMSGQVHTWQLSGKVAGGIRHPHQHIHVGIGTAELVVLNITIGKDEWVAVAIISRVVYGGVHVAGAGKGKLDSGSAGRAGFEPAHGPGKLNAVGAAWCQSRQQIGAEGVGGGSSRWCTGGVVVVISRNRDPGHGHFHEAAAAVENAVGIVIAEDKTTNLGGCARAGGQGMRKQRKQQDQ